MQKDEWLIISLIIYPLADQSETGASVRVSLQGSDKDVSLFLWFPWRGWCEELYCPWLQVGYTFLLVFCLKHLQHCSLSNGQMRENQGIDQAQSSRTVYPVNTAVGCTIIPNDCNKPSSRKNTCNPEITAPTSLTIVVYLEELQHLGESFRHVEWATLSLPCPCFNSLMHLLVGLSGFHSLNKSLMK